LALLPAPFMPKFALGLVLIACGCLKGPPAFVPPSRIDVAPVIDRGGRDVALHLAAAVSWASLRAAPETTQEIGLGYVHQGGAGRQAPATEGLAPLGPPASIRPALHGAFVEVGRRIHRRGAYRTWATSRLEFLTASVDGHRRHGLGAVTHLHWEMFSPVRSRGALGTVGLGVFAEAGARRVAGQPGALFGLAGLSLRLPLMAAQ
jgi:hypothetical protein